MSSWSRCSVFHILRVFFDVIKNDHLSEPPPLPRSPAMFFSSRKSQSWKLSSSLDSQYDQCTRILSLCVRCDSWVSFFAVVAVVCVQIIVCVCLSGRVKGLESGNSVFCNIWLWLCGCAVVILSKFFDAHGEARIYLISWLRVCGNTYSSSLRCVQRGRGLACPVHCEVWGVRCVVWSVEYDGEEGVCVIYLTCRLDFSDTQDVWWWCAFVMIRWLGGCELCRFRGREISTVKREV